MDAAATAGGCPASTGVRAQRCSELLDAHLLDLAGEAVIGGAALRTLGRVGDPGAGSDQCQPLDAPGERGRECGVERDPPAHRVPDEREARWSQRRQVVEHGLQRDRLSPGRGAVPADVGRERPVAFRQRRDHGVPARSGVGEAVEEDDIARHQNRIMTVTDTYLLLRAFCDELARSGMEHACTAPGSRCTPIVLTLAREQRIHTWSHIDERCAGFFALGAAKRSGRPVAVTCTSGTAAANLTPAVIEARHARGAADRAHRRPPGGAARRRRRPDDRPAEAVRRRGQVVLRGRRRRGQPGDPAVDPDARVSGLLDRGGGAARAGPPQLPAPRAACARSRIRASRGRHRPRRGPPIRRRSTAAGRARRPAGRPRPGGS